MPTIKDIARAVGVSHATVSNVLNHKGNVSAQKVKLVMDAAQAMGYHVNEAASTLRSGSAQTLAVILPDTGSTAYDDLYRSLCQAAAEKNYNMLLRLTNNVPCTELKAIEDVLASRAKCVVVVSSLPDPAEQYKVLQRSGIEVVFAIRGEQPGYLYAGFNLAFAAEELSKRVLEEGASSVGVMTNMTSYPSQAIFQKRFLALTEASCRITRVESIASQYAKQAFSLFEADGPDAIVTTSEEMARAAINAGLVLGKSPRVYTLAPQRIIRMAQYTAYELNYRQLGLELGRMLTAEDREKNSISGQMPGFPTCFQPVAVRKERRLSLLTADTPVARALEKLLPRLKADTGLNLSITTLPTQAVSSAFSQSEWISQYDMARMDMSLIDCWAEELFTPIDELQLDEKEILTRLLPGIAHEYSQIGEKYYGLPFDPGCHLLFYREDLLFDPLFQRKYYEAFHEQLSVPDDREGFLRTVQFLSQMNIQERGIKHPTILTRRSSECLSSLASFASDGHWPHLRAEDLERYIQRQRVLESCAGFVDNGSWNSAVSRFAHGDCALLIAHSNYACHLADEPLSTVSGRVGYALSPGDRAFLGGGVLGVLKTSDRKKESALFLNWLFSPEISQLLALLSGCSPLSAVYESEELSDIYPWLKTVRDGLTNGTRRFLMMRPHHHFDLMALEKRIAQLCDQAVKGIVSSRKATDMINEMVFIQS